MNIFGTFSYGNIIKTFIPGIIMAACLALLIDDYNYWRSGSYLFFSAATKQPILTIGLLIPLSIFMGIVSNSLCFKWFIPKFVENQFNSSNCEFIEYKEKVINEMKAHYKSLHSYPEDIADGFDEFIDGVDAAFKFLPIGVITGIERFVLMPMSRRGRKCGAWRQACSIFPDDASMLKRAAPASSA